MVIVHDTNDDQQVLVFQIYGYLYNANPAHHEDEKQRVYVYRQAFLF